MSNLNLINFLFKSSTHFKLHIQENCKIQRQEITPVSYTHLDVYKRQSLDKAIRERNNLGRKSIALLNNILWYQQISKQNKHRIYNTIVKPITSYGCEIWPITQRTEKLLEATEMDYWRRAAGRSKLEKVRNVRIREIMGGTVLYLSLIHI